MLVVLTTARKTGPTELGHQLSAPVALLCGQYIQRLEISLVDSTPWDKRKWADIFHFSECFF